LIKNKLKKFNFTVKEDKLILFSKKIIFFCLGFKEATKFGCKLKILKGRKCF